MMTTSDDDDDDDDDDEYIQAGRFPEKLHQLFLSGGQADGHDLGNVS